MCELLGMDCNTPTDILFSFTGFSQRGGRTGPHGDGWGLAFFEGKAVRAFVDSSPCAESPLASFVRSHSIKTMMAVSHIRKMTRGRVKLANTHPFVRELWGRAWVFAHNGTVKGVPRVKTGRFVPIGETDSERAFCTLMNRVARRFPTEPEDPSALWSYVARVAAEIGRRGTFNFILANGDVLFARCDTKLCFIERRAPFGKATLKDHDVSVDFGAVTTPRDRVAVVATAPLTVDEVWTHGEPGTLWVFRKGRLAATLRSGPSRAAG